MVAPTSLLFNWEQELARFYPGLKVHVYTGTERTLDAGDGDVVLTTYGLVRRDIETLERTPFHVIVFDEAHSELRSHIAITLVQACDPSNNPALFGFVPLPDRELVSRRDKVVGQ